MRLIHLLAAMLLIGFSFSVHAQGNAADFDNISGYIEVPDASIYVPKEGISIEAWVFPRNENVGWPDFDGIFGFRNNNTCDFYMLHLSTNEVEARFRNSDGEDFTIVNGGFILNEWNHIAMTYGDGFLSYYLNGQFQQVIAANGVCGDESTPFTIGRTDFQGSDFYFDGLVDEVRFWFETRTEEQIEQYYACQISEPEDYPTLGLYYRMDETTGATTVLDDGDSGLTGNIIPEVSFVESTVPWKIVDATNEIENHDISIYPNPSAGTVNIELENINFERLLVRNVAGNVVSANHIQTSETGVILNNLPPGTYFISVIYEDQSFTEKLVILE